MSNAARPLPEPPHPALSEDSAPVSEAQFRSFAAHSTNLIWISDPAAGKILYRSAAYERIWGVPCSMGPADMSRWMEDVHPEDRQHVENALARVAAGEVVRFEYRILRPPTEPSAPCATPASRSLTPQGRSPASAA